MNPSDELSGRSVESKKVKSANRMLEFMFVS